TYKTTWFKARAACQKLGGDLAVPINNKENSAIFKIVKQKSQPNPFIGFRRHKDNKFYTVQGVKPTFMKWQPGEPNGPNHEHCVQFYKSDGKWNDIPCSHQNSFICQRHLIKRKYS
ncbi:Hypothetical predicted protein, partial [Paramuricea clavata]